MEFTAFSRQVIDQLESDIPAYIQACKLPSPLHEASLYAMTNGGKRVRPLLIAATFATVKPTTILPTHPINYLMTCAAP